jgi:GT2 family glycosyltransferase
MINKIYIIIPVHNRINYTIKCINSIYDQKIKNIQIIIIDDGSEDDTSEIINNMWNDILIVKGNGSLWWTGAVAIGVEYVLKIANKNDYLMTINNDIILEHNVLIEMYKEVEMNNKFIISALSIDINNKKSIIDSGSIMKSWILNYTVHPLKNKLLTELGNTKLIDVDILNGRCVIYPIKIFNELGNFNYVLFPHYGGDNEFTFRAKRNGWSLKINPKAVIYVDQEATGVNTISKHLNMRNLFLSLWSIKSSNHLGYRTKYALKVPPWYAIPTFLLITYFKIFTQLLIGNLIYKYNNYKVKLDK